MLKDKYEIYIFGFYVLAHFLPSIRVGFDSVSGISKYYKIHNNWKYQWFIIVILKWKLNQSLILMNNLQNNILAVKPEFWKITKKNYAIDSHLGLNCFYVGLLLTYSTFLILNLSVLVEIVNLSVLEKNCCLIFRIFF